MSKTLITSRDPKGLHATSLFEAAYNKAKLDEMHAQLLNEHGGEFQDGILGLIEELTMPERKSSRGFIADLSRELECDSLSHGGKVRFDPRQAKLVFQGFSVFGENGGTCEDYYFITSNQKNIRLSFRRRGWFRKSLDKPYLYEFDEKNMRAHLSISRCPLEVIEEHFGPQTIS